MLSDSTASAYLWKPDEDSTKDNAGVVPRHLWAVESNCNIEAQG